MQIRKIVTAVLFIMAAATSSQAQAKTRIRQGVRSGELTRHETRTLVKQQRDIKKDKREARADGVVTPAERKDIRQDKKQASASIYRKKHNLRERN